MLAVDIFSVNPVRDSPPPRALCARLRAGEISNGVNPLEAGRPKAAVALPIGRQASHKMWEGGF
ncbi:MAG: hypothetical protein A3A80_00145 [Candidatus Terrybacteria bacterium RIFCSPLOWO2_01_FULL_44_24]|uniref:Uncharacterized protein n=1 Tax=Candidatus Terrybacteria bacterium RIFCSPHIGHO2_01_FULL_43_35 TaxID=1802361 RepID=A0A1G2PCW6_9BACT|nr:MAG: hypothetical protein A2828_00655 [Candidatus Terrybacteria bacterium RIFCSPHIGHO2_01_FULL_43_35]OHA50450.1 MAG: hypothetical protein A3B75_00850 [Candidatus Terrybacteria bacterium RIFCSPHIGHO2_02_FULL_43_14]OHA51092.1 MAG: hypothetical protein A3A80_00145 [Candidatus Terrybacteria bacterium RIFCSPLOWO2_01_FULL_44_24]